MADDKELEVKEGGSKKKLIVIIAVAVLLLGGGAGAYFMFMGGSDTPMPEQDTATAPAEADDGTPQAKLGSARYVAMPRPFVFNVPGIGRDRLVQIEVQLMVRGNDNEEEAKKHIPMIEGTLLRVFSSTNAEDLATEAGKVALKEQSTREVRAAMKDVSGREVVEKVLFTGFVMQ
ncbi:hypothetical protein HMF8227_02096 [Saliniradius amylolyticus]|uniref:Flagellar protein FliL n=1 Tax=Saliniradius amylolyticus TaxID=2183582 RepID=A0A2S2E6G6_9ALTE|nr:flagellar basal body-associated protein FliL [Saliniradius amylolyticus]AWL12557.1 hypothetical protein HMF8227_02096 [Saliniradius amylolyticus]